MRRSLAEAREAGGYRHVDVLHRCDREAVKEQGWRSTVRVVSPVRERDPYREPCPLCEGSLAEIRELQLRLWSKEMYDAFGPMRPGIWFEDEILTLRAWLFDRIVFIPEALVRYREHDSNMVNRAATPLTTPHARHQAEEAMRVEAQRRRESLLSYLPDLELAVRRHWITQPVYEELKQHIAERCTLHQAIEKWWSFGWIKRLGWFLFFVASGRLREGRWCSTRLLPFATFLSLAAIRSRIRG
jgi:hypothetical protein